MMYVDEDLSTGTSTERLIFSSYADSTTAPDAFNFRSAEWDCNNNSLPSEIACNRYNIGEWYAADKGKSTGIKQSYIRAVNEVAKSLMNFIPLKKLYSCKN